jgi:flagella basal body P-ring formation protein FlgA
MRRGLAAALGLKIAAVASVLLSMPVLGQDIRSVPVPRTTIYPGDTIVEGALMDRDFRVVSRPPLPFHAERETIIGKIARRTLIAGQLIALDAIRAPFAVTQGQAVQMVYERDGLSITGQGVAMQSAAIDEIVSVRNPDTGIIIKGRVMPNHSVAVDDR